MAERPALERPVLIGAFRAGTTAARPRRSRPATSPGSGTPRSSRTSIPSFVDFQATRPHVSLDEGRRAGSSGRRTRSSERGSPAPTGTPCSSSASSRTTAGGRSRISSPTSRATSASSRRHARRAARRRAAQPPSPVTGAATDQHLVGELGLLAARATRGRRGSSESSRRMPALRHSSVSLWAAVPTTCPWRRARGRARPLRPALGRPRDRDRRPRARRRGGRLRRAGRRPFGDAETARTSRSSSSGPTRSTGSRSPAGFLGRGARSRDRALPARARVGRRHGRRRRAGPSASTRRLRRPRARTASAPSAEGFALRCRPQPEKRPPGWADFFRFRCRGGSSAPSASARGGCPRARR